LIQGKAARGPGLTWIMAANGRAQDHDASLYRRACARAVRAEGNPDMTAMTNKTDVVDAVRAALASEPRLDLHRYPVDVDFEDGTLTLEGEVPNVAAKKLALEGAAAVPEVTGILDRLHVIPAQRMGDGRIRDLVRDALLQEPALAEVAVRERVKGEVLSAREPSGRTRGWICVSVADGVVTLEGEVPSIAHKRLAGVLAWWVPGSRDVINGLGTTGPELEEDDEISDAVRMVLEKDPFVDAGQVRLATRGRVVTLRGLVPTESEREMAEFDVWYVFGVDRVRNEIEVRAFEPTGQYG
jgi:osmotically-inducible protein OsmY